MWLIRALIVTLIAAAFVVAVTPIIDGVSEEAVRSILTN